MSALDVWLRIAVPALVSGLLARAIWVIVAVETSAWWLRRAPAVPRADQSDIPWMVVLLPMLREQSLARQAIAAFTSLDYPRERVAVVVVTTERETTARQRHRDRLPALAAQRLLQAEQLRGLFPAARCRQIADEVNAAPLGKRLMLLAERFDAEPTTAEVVKSVVLDRPGTALPLVHLHQPDLGGGKAGQLNFALDRLPEVLGPLGWCEKRDAAATYAVVYDVDAIPDARTLNAFAATARTHASRTGRVPALIQQQRLPLLGRRPFPTGPIGVILTGEWAYQMRRSLGIELARVRLHHRLTASSLPEWVRMWLRPMVYAVGCGMAVHLPAIRALGGFPEPMEDLGTGHRLSLLGADLTATTVGVLDEPYTEPSGLANLHALAFMASLRPDRQARAVAHLPAAIPRSAQALLMLREWADEASWLIGAPLIAAAVASAWWAGPTWMTIAVLGVLLHGPLPTARLLAEAPALHADVIPPRSTSHPPPTSPHHPAAVIAASPFQPFVRLAGPWRLIFRKLTGRHRDFGKTER